MKIFYLLIFLFFLSSAYSQVTPTDSTASKKAKVDTTKQRTWDPKVAARRSAIIPGWGQAYNKKYWKIPIVYTGLGISGYVFVNNIKIYKEYKFAYSARIKAQPPTLDSTDYHQLDDIYKVLSPNSIRSARDEFRRYVDYSALVFLLLWGLNVVDAANLSSIRWKPSGNELFVCFLTTPLSL